MACLIGKSVPLLYASASRRVPISADTGGRRLAPALVCKRVPISADTGGRTLAPAYRLAWCLYAGANLRPLSVSGCHSIFLCTVKLSRGFPDLVNRSGTLFLIRQAILLSEITTLKRR